MSDAHLSTAGPDKSPATAAATSPAVIPFAQLASGEREVLIEHNGQLYRLRVTRNDKLILSK